MAPPNVLDALDRSTWQSRAACRDEDPACFFPEEGRSAKKHVEQYATGAALLPILICERCPVRRDCLRDALATWRFNYGRLSSEHGRDREEPINEVRSIGVWGGAVSLEREAALDAAGTVEGAIELLERTLPERIAQRVAAYGAAKAATIARAKAASRRAPPASERDRQIASLLETRADEAAWAS